MITSIKLKDPDKAPLTYLSKVKSLRKGTEITFKPGVNVIIGKNGSGKSTIIRLLQIYTFCCGEMESTMRRNDLINCIKGSFDKLTSFLGDHFHGGVDVVADYSIKTFNLCDRGGFLSNDVFSRDRVLARLESNSKSAGEEKLFFFEFMCEKLFSDKLRFKIDYDYCAGKARPFAEKYYARNHRTGEVMPTLLMDEPDQNLDVINGRHLYNILGKKQREDTQVIASLHNPALIYKLSKLDCVNFIELTEGYLDKVVKFVTK